MDKLRETMRKSELYVLVLLMSLFSWYLNIVPPKLYSRPWQECYSTLGQSTQLSYHTFSHLLPSGATSLQSQPAHFIPHQQTYTHMHTNTPIGSRGIKDTHFNKSLTWFMFCFWDLKMSDSSGKTPLVSSATSGVSDHSWSSADSPPSISSKAFGFSFFYEKKWEEINYLV